MGYQIILTEETSQILTELLDEAIMLYSDKGVGDVDMLHKVTWMKEDIDRQLSGQ